MIWRPRIYAHNTQSTVPETYDKATTLKLDISSGDLRWWSQFYFDVACTMDFGDFPMDANVCRLWLASLSSKEDFKFKTTFVDATNKNETIQHEYTLEEIDYYSPGNPFLSRSPGTVFGFALKMRRRIGPSLLNQYLPTGLLVKRSLVTFACDSKLSRPRW